MLNKLRVRMKFSPRVIAAAQQMYSHVQAGRAFEVPSGMGTDDLTIRAVMCLRQMYPEVPVMYQARTVIIGHVDQTMKVSKEAWKELERGKYLPKAALAHNPEAFLNDQAAWLGSQGLNRSEEIVEGQRRQAERDRLVLSGGSAIDAERKAETKPVEADPEYEKEKAVHQQRNQENEKRAADMVAAGVPPARAEAVKMGTNFDEPEKK